MITTAESMLNHLKDHGLQARVVPIEHIYDLKNELESQYAHGFLAEEFYQERMQFYQFCLPEDFSTATSLSVVAIPRPQTPVNFTLDGVTMTLILPPTYSGYQENCQHIMNHLREWLAPGGYRVAHTLLPLKLLAAHSGLTEYGRNNICYIPGMGSFFQLAAYYSDLPAGEDTWQEPRMMERCKTCHACLNKCPTGAISADRFLLHAEKCLSFHNERQSSTPFPAWIDPGSHNSLMGCMLCQRYCPEDKPFLGWFEQSQDFTQEETLQIMRGVTRDQLSIETVKKLENLELIDDLDKLPRNIMALLPQSEIEPGLKNETTRGLKVGWTTTQP